MPRGDWTEEQLMDCLFDIHDNGYTLSQVAQKYGIPKSTVSKRINGVHLGPDDTSQHPLQRLTNVEETRLVEWILRQESIGYAPSPFAVRHLVTRILKKRGDEAPLGRKWLNGFKHRHPQLTSKIGRRQEAARFSGFTHKSID